MKTEMKLAEALKNLMAKESIDTITVKRLTAMCGINRQTFYYHFRDIYDLITWIYLNESVENLDKATSTSESLLLIFSYLKRNEAIIKNTLASAGRELVIQFLYNTCYNLALKAVIAIDRNPLLTVEERKFIGNFYAPSYVYMLINWVDSGMKEEPKVLVERALILVESHIVDHVIKIKNKRGI